MVSSPLLSDWWSCVDTWWNVSTYRRKMSRCQTQHLVPFLWNQVQAPLIQYLSYVIKLLAQVALNQLFDGCSWGCYSHSFLFHLCSEFSKLICSKMYFPTNQCCFLQVEAYDTLKTGLQLFDSPWIVLFIHSQQKTDRPVHTSLTAGCISNTNHYSFSGSRYKTRSKNRKLKMSLIKLHFLLCRLI